MTLARNPFPPALAAWLLFGSAAYAQVDAGTTTAASSGVIKPRLLTVGGEEEENITMPSMGVRECLDNVTLEFELNDIPEGKESIDIYTGDACNLTDRNSVDKNCNYVTTREISATQLLKVEVPAGDLTACDGTANAKPTFWFLAVVNPESMEDVGTGYGEYKELRIDLEVPDAPSGVTGGSGESQIPVRWDSEETDIEKFVVFVDSSPTSGGGSSGSSANTDAAVSAESAECGSSVLRSGDDAGSVPSGVRRKNVAGGSTSSTNLSGSEIDGDSAAVAVIAVDEAGNESPLSEVACVQVVPTEGFWDRYQANGGAVDGGCPCTALGPVHARNAWPIALALSYLGFAARRRRRS